MQPYYYDGKAGITIYHGDCRDVLHTLSRNGLGVVTDPPYGVAHATNRKVRGVGASWLKTQIANDNDTTIRDEILAWAEGLPAIAFGSWKQPKPKNTRAVLIWDKGPASGMGDLSLPWKPSWEEIYIIGNGFRGTRDEGVLRGYTVVTWESSGRCHPNEKPISLMRALVNKVVANTIIDPFMGSGPTLRAAKDLGRRAIGIEIEERYCEIAARRLQQEVMDLR
jgi:DNA modification methylase